MSRKLLRRFLYSGVALAMGCSNNGSISHGAPSEVAATRVDSSAIVTLARTTFNNRRVALGFDKIPDVPVERFLGHGQLHFVQFAVQDSSNYVGHIVRVSGNDAIVIDTLPNRPPCDGPKASFVDSSIAQRAIFELAARTYWTAIGSEAAHCSNIVLALSGNEADSTILIKVEESWSRLIYGGGIVRIHGDSAQLVTMFQR